MENQLTIDPHTLRREKETWTLQFRHYMFTPADGVSPHPDIRIPQRVGILMEAVKEGETPADRENIVIGTASFVPGLKPDIIRLTTHPDTENFVDALLENGLAKRLGETIERHQDYPGADEIEEFRFRQLDITEYYNQYIKDSLKRTEESPISHISLCQGEICNGVDPQDYIKCRIGGIEQKRAWVGLDGRKFIQVAACYPDSRAQLYELVLQSHAKQLRLYNEAKVRVTDARTIFNQGTHYVRCKIDGVQQMAKEVGRLDICDYQISKDMHALVSKYFAGELETGLKNSMSRSR